MRAQEWVPEQGLDLAQGSDLAQELGLKQVLSLVQGPGLEQVPSLVQGPDLERVSDPQQSLRLVRKQALERVREPALSPCQRGSPLSWCRCKSGRPAWRTHDG